MKKKEKNMWNSCIIPKMNIIVMSDECPENKDFDDWEGKYPCGQQNCWVTCHCREIME